MTDAQGIWLYAVTRAPGLDVIRERPGVAGEPPRVVEKAGLTAVVGDVPLSEFSEEALHRNLEDLDWLSARARAHDGVIRALAGRGPVVPVRLATVYHDDDSVLLLLEQRAGEFERALEQVSGRTEWGVKVFLESAPEPDRAAGPSSGRGAGAAYLARRRAAMGAEEHHRQRAAEQTDRVHSQLAALAAGARTHPPQSRTLAGDDAPMILNAAYLVDDEHARSFAGAVAECDRDNDAIRVRLTGPWPPYSFSFVEEP